MNKRGWVLVSVFVAVNLAIMVLAWRHTRHAQPQSRATKLVQLSLAEGITPSEIQDATNVLAQERRMWSQFKGLSAVMNVAFVSRQGDRSSFEAKVLVRQVPGGTKPLPRYEMLLSDPQGRWSIQSDETSPRAAVVLPDSQTARVINAVGPASLLQMLTAPQYMLLTIYTEKPSSVTWVTLDDVLKVWPPWRTADSNSPPHSYAYFGGLGKPMFYLYNGHLARCRLAELVGPKRLLVVTLDIDFSEPVESCGIWYPTVIRAPSPWPYPAMSRGWLDIVPPGPPGSQARVKPNGEIRITLSGVAVSV